MTQDILITPGSGQPQISFIASGVNDTPININVISRGSSTHPSGSVLAFDGQEGRLMTIGDKSEGSIFSVADLSGLPILEVNGSGYARVGRHGNYFAVGSGTPQYGLDVFSSGIFREGVIFADKVPASTTDTLYNSGGALYFNGSEIGAGGGGDVTTSQLNYVSGIAVYSSGQAVENESDIVAISGIAAYASGNVYSDDDTYVSGVATYASGQAISNQSNISTNTSSISTNTSGINYVSGIAIYASGQAASAITEIPLSGLQFEVSGSNDEYRIGTTFVDPDGTEQTVRASDFNGGFLRLEVARFSPSVSAAGQSRSWDQPVSQWTVTVDNPTDFTTNYVSGVKSPLTGITGSVTSDVNLYSTSGPSVEPGGGIDWTQTFSTDGDSPIYSSTNDLTGGSASATVSFLDKNQATISETATITFNWSSASNAISFGSLSGKNFLETYTSTTYNLTINNISDLSNTSTTITSSQGSLSNSSDDGTITFTTAIHKDNNSGRTITATTDFTRPDTVTGTEYTAQDVSSDSSISATFTYPSFYIFTASTSNVPSRADIVDTNDFDSSTVTELGNQAKTIDQYINNPDGVPKCWWFGVRSSASQPTSFETGSGPSLLVGATPTEATVDLEPDSPPAGYSSEEYKLYGITLNPGNTYVKIS